MSNLSAIGSLPSGVPSALDYTITSKQERAAAGLPANSPYLEDYQNAANQDYQVALQLWLAENYPEIYRKGMENAGYNPNFAPNIDNPSSPTGFKSSVIENKQKQIQSDINTVNMVLNGVNTSMNLLSDILSLPKEQAYLQWRNIAAGKEAEMLGYKSDSAYARSLFDMLFYGGASSEGFPAEINGVTWNPSGSPAMNQVTLRNDAMQLLNDTRDWDLKNLKPAQLDFLNERIKDLGIDIGLDSKMLNQFELVKYSPIVSAVLIGLLRSFLKR